MNAIGWVVYIVAICAMFYFIGVRPQQKERKKQQEMLATFFVHDGGETQNRRL